MQELTNTNKADFGVHGPRPRSAADNFNQCCDDAAEENCSPRRHRDAEKSKRETEAMGILSVSLW
jgi:hypothetical protein